MKIFVTGSCGYIGTLLVRRLLQCGHYVTGFDTGWFGDYLEDDHRLTKIKGDMRTFDENLDGFDTVIHLANIANDPSVELNPELSWDVNVLGTYLLLARAKECGVKHFLYASSGSVYGVQDVVAVTEEIPLVPISTYNRTKMVAERVCLSFDRDMTIHCIRPATVCGFSPRQRLDVAVNALTYQALAQKRISVDGGDQMRPHIHILDMVRVYEFFVDKPTILSGCYNAGFENLSIADLANRIAERVGAKVFFSETNDPRSYRLDSSKLLAAGFQPSFNVLDAVDELRQNYEAGLLSDGDQTSTVKWMKALGLGV